MWHKAASNQQNLCVQFTYKDACAICLSYWGSYYSVCRALVETNRVRILVYRNGYATEPMEIVADIKNMDEVWIVIDWGRGKVWERGGGGQNGYAKEPVEIVADVKNMDEVGTVIDQGGVWEGGGRAEWVRNRTSGDCGWCQEYGWSRNCYRSGRGVRGWGGVLNWYVTEPVEIVADVKYMDEVGIVIDWGRGVRGEGEGDVRNGYVTESVEICGWCQEYGQGMNCEARGLVMFGGGGLGMGMLQNWLRFCPMSRIYWWGSNLLMILHTVDIE